MCPHSLSLSFFCCSGLCKAPFSPSDHIALYFAFSPCRPQPLHPTFLRGAPHSHLSLYVGDVTFSLTQATCPLPSVFHVAAIMDSLRSRCPSPSPSMSPALWVAIALCLSGSQHTPLCRALAQALHVSPNVAWTPWRGSRGLQLSASQPDLTAPGGRHTCIWSHSQEYSLTPSVSSATSSLPSSHDHASLGPSSGLVSPLLLTQSRKLGSWPPHHRAKVG